jgi:hypothetical protein
MTMGANELTALLWRERELLDLLIFKLTEEQLLLTGGQTRWLGHATSEVEATIKLLRTAGLARTVEISVIAKDWGLDGEPTLLELAAVAPAPWGEIFTSHHSAMSGQAAQIKVLRDSNESFLRAASRSTQETLASLRPEAGTYNSQGVTGSQSSSPSIFDTHV